MIRRPLRPSTTPLRQSHSANRKKRQARYAKHLRSPYFRALRLEAFERDGFRCTELFTIEAGVEVINGNRTRVVELMRCPVAVPSGRGLHADHLTYARFGHELVEDLATRCKACHMRRHALEGKRIR